MELTTANYKQTEVGLIPEDWEVRTLGDIGDIKMCKRIFSYQTSKRGDVPFFKIGTFGKEPDAFISWELYQEFRKKYSFPKEGYLLISASGTIGRTVEYKGEDAYYQDSNIIWIDNDEKLITNKYLNYTLKVVKYKTEGSTIKRLYNSIIKRSEFAIPPTIEEQEAIATSLSDVDDLISNLDKLISKKKAIKQGAMQQLLTPPHKGGKRLAGFTRDWVETPLDNVAWYQEGPGLRKWQFTDKGIKVINITNLVNGYLDLDKTQRHITWDEFNKMYQHFEIDEGDIVVASSGNSYCKTAVVRKQDLPLVMNTSVIRFKPKENLDYKLLLIFLKSSLFKDQIDLLITGGAQPNFGPAHLKKINIMLPPTKEEQSALANILYDMEMEIEQLETKKGKYQDIKQGMMQELLTGKTRLV